MAVDILYFAWVRERIGVAQEQVTPPEGVATIADLLTWLSQRGAGYADALSDPSRIRAAIDHNFVAADAAIAGAREIALFPPVTGG